MLLSVARDSPCTFRRRCMSSPRATLSIWSAPPRPDAPSGKPSESEMAKEETREVETRQTGDGRLWRVETRSRPYTLAELENALWLRETPSGLLASAFHGGHAEGFDLAISKVTTGEIRAAVEAEKAP